MGKVSKLRYRRRFINFWIICCCRAGLGDEDEEDIYERNPIEKDAIDDIFEDEMSLIKEDAFEKRDSYTDGSLVSNNTSEQKSATEGETTPKRPDSFKEKLLTSFEQCSDIPEVLRRLDTQSCKLDLILEKLEESQNVEALQECLQKLHKSVDCYLKSDQQATIETDPLPSRDTEFQCFTYPTVSETREAAEHDEVLWSPQTLTYTNPSTVERSQFLRTSSGTTSPKSFVSSQPRIPKEHDSGITSEANSTPRFDSTQLAEIIREQFQELQRCSREHSSICKNGIEEVRGVISEMKAQVESLPGASKRQNADLLRTRSFVRCSYPSPVRQGKQGGTEIIEMDNLSPR